MSQNISLEKELVSIFEAKKMDFCIDEHNVIVTDKVYLTSKNMDEIYATLFNKKISFNFAPNYVSIDKTPGQKIIFYSEELLK